MTRQSHKDMTVRFTVIDKGEQVRQRFSDSLHLMFDEAQRAAIRLPHGLWYVGPISRGLSMPVDETQLEAVFDSDLISVEQIRYFLERQGLKVELQVE
jgi:hypothetical protein